ncbi:MAG: type II toxin-antitoxin system VapC family toxin [Thioalkalivibrio sp.]|nr:type II toxin-antitoxin system VapC family toxin [Thioalkalivibrio sp.]
MKRAFVDTSALVAIALGEPHQADLRRVMDDVPDLFAAPLMEAEFRSVLAREGVEDGLRLLDVFRWVLPDRPLSEELGRVFAAGYQRGADAWHLATALFLAEHPGDLPLVSLDERQRGVAAKLGFPIIPRR